jgi:23S rRNA (adenine2503-C2)-methyltransferase
MDNGMKKNILDLSFCELKAAMLEFKFEKFRFTQLCDWIYKKHIFDFSKMTSFSKDLQAQLAEKFTLFVPTLDEVVQSKKDSSYKFLLKTHDGNLIEAILMLAHGRATLCVSCMIGCPLKCRFCATGSEVGFIRKLYAGEIVGQFLVVEKYAQEHKLADHITNVVFMGMGEPFLNLDSVGRAIATFTDEKLFGLSKSKITVSTAGVGVGAGLTAGSKSTAGSGLDIADFINKYGVNLAVSLHFPNDALRSEYMPVNKVFPLEKLVAELKKINLSKRDYIMIEYIMLDGINDKPEHARQLVKLLSSVKVKFNLIPYNPTGLFDAKPSSEKAINDFALLLKAKGFIVTVRRSRGVDIEGGCGQFALKRAQR